MFKKDMEKKIVSNGELFAAGKAYKKTLDGYTCYLYDRNYGVFSNLGHTSTMSGYRYALERICKYEGCSFDELLENATEYSKMYGTEGIKRELGNTGRGTWRNALNRLKDFKDYFELCEKTMPPKKPIRKVMSCPLEAGDVIEHRAAGLQHSNGEGVVQSVDKEKGVFFAKHNCGIKRYSFSSLEDGLVRIKQKAGE